MMMLVAALLATLAAVGCNAPAGDGTKAKPGGEPAMAALRDQALRVDAATLGLKPTKERAHVWGVLMEIAFQEGVATVVALGDGTASLYFSGGGGIIGAGGHQAVRQALEPLLQAAEKHLVHFTPAATTPLPEPGHVRFYVRTFEGTLLAEAREEELQKSGHVLHPLYESGQALITAMRETSESR